MNTEPPQPRYVANPVIVAPLSEGVLLKRGSVEVNITGRAVAEIVSTLLELLHEPRTKAEVLEQFPAVMQDSVAALFDGLVARRLLEVEGDREVPDQIESPTELFFWEYRIGQASLSKISTSRRFLVLGVNAVSRAVAGALREGGFSQVAVVDVPNLRNVTFEGEDGGISPTKWSSALPTPRSLEEVIEEGGEFDCLVGTSDFGGLHLMRDWNRFAVDNGVAFFPVVLQNMRGYLGPLVVPGETACFECYRARQNSHMSDPEGRRASEYVAQQTQLGTSSLPAMANALGNLAALELTKFFAGRIAGWHVGHVYEVDMLELSMQRRRVLKIPRCSVCDRRNQQSAVSLDEKLFMPHQARAE